MRRTTLLLTCVFALTGVACSSNAASIPPARAVEKSAAISAGDGECTSLTADQKKLVDDFKSKHPQTSTEDARQFLIDTLSPRVERFVGDFHRIGEPTKDKPEWDTIVDNLDKDLTDYKAKISTDPVGLLTAKPFSGEAAELTTYGFKQCPTQLS